MSASNGITYESMLTYLKTAEKQISSTLDINCFYNPFDYKHNYETISDLQIYCDTLLNHLCDELTQLSPFSHHSNHSSNSSDLYFNNNNIEINNGIKNISIYENMRRIVALDSVETNSHSPESGSQSPLLLTESANSLVNSIPSPSNSNNSNINTISSTSSLRKSNNHLNNNSYHISYHRLSFYENNDEIAAELLTAQQLHSIVSTNPFISHLFLVFLFTQL